MKSGLPTCLDVISLLFQGLLAIAVLFQIQLCVRQDCCTCRGLVFCTFNSRRSGSKASLSRHVTVTDVERPSLPQSASRRVLSIVPDKPVNFLQAVWMPCLRPVLAGTHWFLLRSFLFSSPTPRTTLVISGCRFTSHLMVQERCVLVLPSCGETVSNVYFGV